MSYARKIGRAICENIILEPSKNGFFLFSKITKMGNKTDKVENCHGAMNWHQNAVVKIWNGLETAAM